MENPTLVFLADRNDLDDQLFGQFQGRVGVSPAGPGVSPGRTSRGEGTETHD
ncbi:MAG: hypothetical protein M3480_00650 [Verrucomicrobiota bacterium]|nr:hypothetical protein [Chthoniobacterales bacterium]MDQ3413479.1 hypothetical protein [Verrucomicrobiota bacterium]